MKRLIKISLTVFFVFCLFNSYSQKFGHIDANKLFSVMPEKGKATEELQGYSKQLEDELMKMQDELKKKYDEYQAGTDKMSDLIKQTKEKELQDLNQRIQNYQQQAQQDLQKKEQELMQPLYEKIRKAIKDVGEENKFMYIYDTSILLYYSNDSKDVFDLVKNKLGIKDEDVKKMEKKEKESKDAKDVKKDTKDTKGKK
ncbi:MAG: OmpH family outer membrane protein [Bacteroidia bacterium]|nr:OmpH family outer membrane protein [Bacteroidia bacterium]